MTNSNKSSRRALMVVGTIIVVALLVFFRLRSRANYVPAPDSRDYLATIRAFYVGAAALEAGDKSDKAQTELTAASKLAPGEPAIWANLGLVALRINRLDVAGTDLQKALQQAPNDGRIVMLQGFLEAKRGKYADAITNYRRASEIDPSNLLAQYALFDEIKQLGGPNSDADRKAVMSRICDMHPDNLFASLELAQLAAKMGDANALRQVVGRLARTAPRWKPNVQSCFRAVQKAAMSETPQSAALSTIVLRNVLGPDPQFAANEEAMKPYSDEPAGPLLRLIKVVTPPVTPAAPDTGLTFSQPTPEPGAEMADAVVPVYLTNDKPPVLVTANEHVVHIPGTAHDLPFPGGTPSAPPSRFGVTAADLHFGFRSDLVLAGHGGLKLYQQSPKGDFADVTAKAKLPDAIVHTSLYGSWAADFDMDGDLDLIVAPKHGAPFVLQNDSDGTFKVKRPFAAVTDIRDFGWADLDGDGVPDAVMVDATRTLHVFLNDRGGMFTERPLPATVGAVAAFTIMDANDDGALDVVALKADGGLIRISHVAGTEADATRWDVTQMGNWAGHPAQLTVETTRLIEADLDNNGGIDLLASAPGASQIWLHDERAHFNPLAAAIPGGICAALDLTGTGRLDLVSLTSGGVPARLLAQSKKRYHWQTLRPTALPLAAEHARNAGDQRINTFGIGGEIEIRAGLLVQIQPINCPVVHFGLGNNPVTNVARIIWPSGCMQTEYDIRWDQAIPAKQRLKGSCPWVFAWNGHAMHFVTDFLWRSPLGLKINAQDTGKVAMTRDWVTIRGDELAPRDGYYDIRVTAELWETHFFDYLALMTVDHPAGTELHLDERFAIPPPALRTYLTEPSHPFAHVTDDNGRDVSDTVRDLDGRYLDTFGRGEYQGITRDHYVEMEMGADAPTSGPLWLVAQGWIHPTDSSVNVAISQGSHVKPQGLSLEVADGKGGWTVARPNLGFPAGKNKTIMIDLQGAFRPGAPRRMRLRTNLEIYWDRLAWAVGSPQSKTRTQLLLPQTAELRYRGFSALNQANASSPELPDYAHIDGTAQRWNDLVGYCTRFGDVKELLKNVDDRYVIMNAGDEMALRFPEQAPPAAGWVRDYVLIGDGWEKDGDFNTAYSKTVLPLPSHAHPEYNTPPGRLEDDPVYRRYPQDWQNYHTRYITPDAYRSALRVRDGQ